MGNRLTNRSLAWLLKVAEDVSPVGHAKIAAAILYKNEVISIGVCSYKTHPIQQKYGRNKDSIYLHAEVDAIIKAQNRIGKRGISLKKCTLYVARVKRPSAFSTNYVAGLAKPCSGCMKAIREAGISNIVYTED